MDTDKATALAALEAELAADTSLPLREANLVFGEGNPDTQVLFIGEAPGLNEDKQKRPFVGRAGQLLRRLIKELGWREEDVYITNIVKRRPPENRDPYPEEIEAYASYLARQIEIISPLLIAPLGRFSMNYFLPKAKITRDQGTVFRTSQHFIFPLIHPAAALRSPDTLGTLRESFMKLPTAIEQCKKLLEEQLSMPPNATAERKAPKQKGLF